MPVDASAFSDTNAWTGATGGLVGKRRIPKIRRVTESLRKVKGGYKVVATGGHAFSKRRKPRR